MATISLRAAACLLCVLFYLVGLIQAQQHALGPHITNIDGCAMLQQHNGTNLTIVVNLTDPSTSSDTSSRLHFTNCAIPDDMDITIAVPPRPSIGDELVGDQHTVHIEVINTTMQGGSLQIIVHDNGTSQQETDAHHQAMSLLSLQHIRVTVNRATLRCDGDVLVVNTTTSSSPTITTKVNVEDITIELQRDVVLTSKNGSVASIITDGNVSHCHIRLEGNIKVEAKHFVSSVQTSRITNSILSIKNRCASCVSPPVHLVAGGEAVYGDAGVLSILPSRSSEHDGVSLHVENVQILVDQKNLRASQAHEQPVLFVAATAAGQAAIASVVLRHPSKAQLTMAGTFAIEFTVPATMEAARETTPQLSLERNAPVPTIYDTIGLRLNATGIGESSAAAVGGITVLTTSTHTIATLDIHSCIVRLFITATFHSHASVFAAQAIGHSSVSALLGVAVNSYGSHKSSSSSSRSSVTISGSSSLTIGSNTAGSHLTMLAPSTHSYLSTALLGVAVNSYASSSSVTTSHSSSSVTISGNSSLAIGSSTANSSHNNVTMLAPSTHSCLSTALLGVAVNSFSYYTRSSSITTLTISGNSNLTIGCNTAGSSQSHVTMLAPSTHSYLSTALLGVAVNSYASTTSRTGGSSSATATVDGSSTLTIVCDTAGSNWSNLTILAPNNNDHLATALLGVAVNSYSSRSNTNMTISGNSMLSVGFTTANSSQGHVIVLAPSTVGGGALATALLGVAVKSHSYYTSSRSSSSVTITSNSSLTIGCDTAWSSDSNVTMHTPTSHDYLATALLGVAVNSASQYKSSSSSSVTISGNSSLAIGSSTANSSQSHLTMLAPSTHSYLSTALLGVAVNSASQMLNSGTSSKLTISGNSNLTIGCNTAWSSHNNLTMLAPSTHSYLSTALLGVAVNSYASSSYSTSLSLATVSNHSRVSIGFSAAGSNSSHVTMLAPTSHSYLATALLGVAVNSFSQHGRSSGQTVMTLTGNSSLTIGCNTAGSSWSNVTVLAPSSKSQQTTALLGVTVNSCSDKWSVTSSKLAITGNSNLTIGSNTAGSTRSNVTMLAPSSNGDVSTALLGVVVNSAHSSSMVLCSLCAVRIFVLLTGGATHFSAEVQGREAVAAVAGAVVRGKKSSHLAANSVSPSRTKVVDVWVALLSKSKLTVGAKSGATGVVLGLVAAAFGGLDSQNTKLSLCIDNVTELPLTFGGSGVALTTSPHISGVEVTRTVGWTQEAAASSDAPAPSLPSTNFSLCNSKTTALEVILGNLVEHVRIPRAWLPAPQLLPASKPFETPSRSTTSSGSEPPTVSTSFAPPLRTSTLTFDVLVSVSRSLPQKTPSSQPSLTLPPTISTALPDQTPVSTATPTTLKTNNESITTTPVPVETGVLENKEDYDIKQQKTTVTILSSTVLVTSVVSSGTASLQDTQALVVLGSMDCANEEVHAVSSGGERSMIPFELPVLKEGSHSRTLLSNVIVLGSTLVVHGLTALFVKIREKRPFVECCGAVRFPAWSITAFVVLYQGTILTAFRVLFTSTTDRAFGAVIVIVCFAVPCIGPFMRRRSGNGWQTVFVHYEHAFECIPQVLRVAVLPCGFFDGSPDVDPTFIVRRFSTLFSSVSDDKHPIFTSLGFGKAFLVAVVASLPHKTLGCTTRFVLLGVISLAVAGLLAAFRPYRMSLNNVLSCLTNLCTAALCFWSTNPSEIRQHNVSTMVIVVVGLGMATSVSALLMKLLEVTKWKKNERRLRASEELHVPMLDIQPNQHKLESDNADHNKMSFSTTSSVAANPLSQPQDRAISKQ